jgi:hypothetical protein
MQRCLWPAVQTNTTCNISMGHAVIFNYDAFDTNDHTVRERSQIDIRGAHEAFSSLLFDIIIHSNLEYSKIKEVISACM